MAEPCSLLGLAMKAGKTVKGDGLLPAIAAGQVHLVVCSSAMGTNRKKKVTDKCATYNVVLMELPELEYNQLGSKAGIALGITDAGFAAAIQKAAGMPM